MSMKSDKKDKINKKNCIFLVFMTLNQCHAPSIKLFLSRRILHGDYIRFFKFYKLFTTANLSINIYRAYSVDAWQRSAP